MKVLVQMFQLLATEISSKTIIGLAQGFVTFDRALLSIVGVAFKVIDFFTGLALNIPGIGPILKNLGAAFITLSAVSWVAGTKIGQAFGGGLILKGISALKDAIGNLVSALPGLIARIAATKLGLIALSTAGVIVVALAVYELVKHFGALNGLMIAGAVAVGGLTVALWAMDAVPMVALVVGIALALAGLVAALIKVGGWVIHLVGDLGRFHAIAGHIVNAYHHVGNALHDVGHVAMGMWHSLFGGGASAKITGSTQHLTTALERQRAATAKAAAAAKQYTNALNGIYPKTGKVTSATKSLIKAEEQIGPSIAKQATGFATFTQGATKSYAQLMANLKKQNVTLAQEMQAARALIKKGMSPKAVESLAATMPQDLVMMSHQSVAHIKSMSQQFNSLMTTAAIVGGKNGFSLATQVVKGLKSSIPATKAWATQMATAMHINTKAVAAKTTTGLKTGFKLTAAAMKVTGVAIMAGLAGGITSGTPLVTTAVAQAATLAIKTANKTVGVKSPSTVFAGIGKNIVAGFAQGISKSQPATAAVQKMSQAVIKAFSPLAQAKGLSAAVTALTNLSRAFSALGTAATATSGVTRTGI
ncbi:MAG: hypothetical protein GJU76_06955, partial [Gallionella sp.]|nr:hypothetical protein [Gallionella sp.]